MKRTLILLSVCLLTFINVCNSFSQGYEIKVKIKNLKNDTLLLGYHFANEKMLYPVDTLVLNSKGEGVFKKKKPLSGGMYIIFLPKKNYFDILISDNQKFTIENDTSNFLKNIKVTGSLDNQLFIDYQKLIVEKSQLAKQTRAKKDSTKVTSEKEKYTLELKKIDSDVREFRTKLIKENPNSFAAKFINATTEIDVPPPPTNNNGKVTDSLFQYHYYKAHYFDNFDISDSRLLRTPIYEEKIKTYTDKVIPQTPDSIIPAIDMLISKSRTSNELFRYMLISLFNEYGQSQIMGMDAVFYHIADKYYIPEATWSDSAMISKLKKQVSKLRTCLIGMNSQNITLYRLNDDYMLEAKDDADRKKDINYVGDRMNLYNVNAKYSILVFWEASCGHCKKAMPIILDIYNKFKTDDVQVIAVNMLGGAEGKKDWIDFVNEHKCYDWVNVWNPYDYSYKDLYNIATTPVIYMLDKDKKIIAKNIGPEQVEDILNFELKKKKK